MPAQDKTNDPRIIAAKEKLQKEKMQKVSKAWLWQMSDPRGRLVISELMEHFGFDKSPFDLNAKTEDRNIGLQDAARHIKDQISSFVGFDGWHMMEKEKAERVDLEVLTLELAVKPVVKKD